METNTSSTMKIAIKSVVSVILLLISGVIGGVIGAKFGAGSNAVPVVYTSAADSSGSSNGIVSIPHQLSGVVTAISGSSFTIKSSATDTEAGTTVVVTGDTSFVETQPKDAATIAADQKAYVTQTAAAAKTPQIVLSPEPFTRTPSTASALSVGDFVTVTSLDNTSSASVVATTVQFHKPIAATK